VKYGIRIFNQAEKRVSVDGVLCLREKENDKDEKKSLSHFYYLFTAEP
jgi:hypothetical protein